MDKHYHFIGIGGIGMGALASLCLDQGIRVSGSDAAKNKMVEVLLDKGAQIAIGHHASNVDSATRVIYSSAIKEDNVELLKANELGIQTMTRATLLADMMVGHSSITIAGAHGKTTTSSMVTQLLIDANFQPTSAVGGIINGLSANALIGNGDYFVAEADESDGSFLNYRPTYSIITNIDLEHLDYYKDWDHLVSVYEQFIKNTQPEGALIVNADDSRLMDLVSSSNLKVVTFSLKSPAQITAKNIQIEGFQLQFDCYNGEDSLGKVRMQVTGEHNVYNALATIALGISLKIDWQVIVDSLASFKGVLRRFTLRADVDNIKIIDDYAHHPVEILTTIQAAQKLSAKRIVSVCQPHRYSRLRYFQDEFAQALSNSDEVIVTDVYAASELPIEGVSGQSLQKRIADIGKAKAQYVPKDQLLEHLIDSMKSGDIILTLGAGDITQVAKDLAKEMQRKKV